MFERFLYGFFTTGEFLIKFILIISGVAIFVMPFVLWVLGTITAWWMLSYFIIIPILGGLYEIIF